MHRKKRISDHSQQEIYISKKTGMLLYVGIYEFQSTYTKCK